MKIKVIGPKDKGIDTTDGIVVITTSISKNWSRGLSPFFLGPCDLYGGLIAQRVENGWQYSKVYKQHTDSDGNPTADYWKWARAGWADKWAKRYPMGKGSEPEYCLWDDQHLGYIDARKKVYVPLYSKAVRQSAAYKQLVSLYQQPDGVLYLWDFDGYDNEKLGMSLIDVLNDPTKIMGHAFILARMLEKGVV